MSKLTTYGVPITTVTMLAALLLFRCSQEPTSRAAVTEPIPRPTATPVPAAIPIATLTPIPVPTSTPASLPAATPTPAPTSTPMPTPVRITTYTQDILPLMTYCNSCHGAVPDRGAYRTDSYSGLLGAGSDGVLNVVLGDMTSRLVTYTSTEVDHESANTAVPGIAAKIRDWVMGGAELGDAE